MGANIFFGEREGRGVGGRRGRGEEGAIVVGIFKVLILISNFQTNFGYN